MHADFTKILLKSLENMLGNGAKIGLHCRHSARAAAARPPKHPKSARPEGKEQCPFTMAARSVEFRL
jgi:hypothetical protein